MIALASYLAGVASGVALLVVFLVVRHTRAEEESGRAELLREAAALMRERAEAATFVYSSLTMQPGQPVPWPSEGDLALDFDEDQAAHIAGMSPAVALAVADWLERAADEPWCCDDCKFGPDHPENMAHAALAVARTYLGSAS